MFKVVALLAAVLAVSAATPVPSDNRSYRKKVIIAPHTLESSSQDVEKVEVIINDCWDYVVTQLNEVMPEGFSIGGGEFTFTEEIFGFEIDGSIYFTNGYLNGFNTFQRIGDAYADVGLGTVDLHVGLVLANLRGGFDAGVDFNGLNWSFDPSFTLNLGITLGLMVGIDGIGITQFEIYFNESDFQIPGLDIIADIESMLVNWLLIFLIDVIGGVFEENILGTLMDELQQVITGEGDICSALVPSSRASVAAPAASWLF